jgi:hypothetical protein
MPREGKEKKKGVENEDTKEIILVEFQRVFFHYQ